MLLDVPRSRWPGSAPGRRARGLVARTTAIVGVVGLLLLAGQQPIWGHAGTELPVATWSADDQVVTGTWTGPPDDAAWIGESIGALPAGSMEAYVGGPSDAYPTEDEIVALSRSPELEAYLLEHVQIQQDGSDCDGQVTVADDFIADGASFRFSCPDEVRSVDITITILHEQDPAFRTFSGDGTLQDALHTADAPEHPFDLTAATSDDEDGGRSSSASAISTSQQGPVVLTLLIGSVVVLAGVVGALRLAGPGRRR